MLCVARVTFLVGKIGPTRFAMVLSFFGSSTTSTVEV